MTKYFNNIFWRWHFYAGLFITPLLITLSISGILYLFYPQVEQVVNHDALFGQTGKPKQSLDAGLHDIEMKYPGWHVMKVSFPKADYNIRITLMGPDDGSKVIYLDHHNHIQAALNPAQLFSNITREFHSHLLTGNTIVNYMVELAACWTLFLIATGLFMTFYKKYLTQPKSKIDRKNKAKFHALLGTVFALPLTLLILSGLPWSGYLGDKIYSFAVDHTVIGFPEAEKIAPVSNNEIPWATRNEHTNSTAAHSARLPLSRVVQLAEEESFHRPYSISVPMDDRGTYVLSVNSATGVTGLDASPFDERTIHLDQYSGMKLAIFDFADYGILAKLIAISIPLHEGQLFGVINQLINLLVTSALLVIAGYGINIYLMRKVRGSLSSPRAQRYNRYSWIFAALLLIMGILMPLFGLSVLVIAVIEIILLLVRRKKKQLTI
ncbi:PepSY-associated TM helix domain-containing protein [Macrococcus equipercicus]|uniref:PepSY domain-containing protein n=1 Tax=Macrococcus equipercicus TaxID=69967 RepID=A0A9Q9F338_9STAP|nr:PepSY domain-containing protein [Macrococcus equipercicus]UTH13484.1 PepSY domain-containing protein [Macrococcus equipercicus]